MTVTLDEEKLKELLKTVIMEVFEEQRELLRELLEEVLEDMALVNAIEAGEETNTVSRDQIFQILEGS